jgi:hypothetical protein
VRTKSSLLALIDPFCSQQIDGPITIIMIKLTFVNIIGGSLDTKLPF